MRIILVRHGHPDYTTDTLTEKGILHAKAAAERLKDEKVDIFYSSSCGRAYETCQYIEDRQCLFSVTSAISRASRASRL